jgi:hypothetical protein
MKTYGGMEVELHHPYPRRYMEVSGKLRAPAALNLENHRRYPLDRRLGGPQGRSGRYGEE